MPGHQMEGSRVFTAHYHFPSLANQNASTTMCQQGSVFTENIYCRYEYVFFFVWVWRKAWVWPCYISVRTCVTVWEGVYSMWLGVCVCVCMHVCSSVWLCVFAYTICICHSHDWMTFKQMLGKIAIFLQLNYKLCLCSIIPSRTHIHICAFMTQSASIHWADWLRGSSRLTLQTGSRRSPGRPQLIYAFLWANSGY